jgi:predicted nucleic acid-binding protein
MSGNNLVFVDTWGWLALGHRREERHEEIKTLYRKLREKNKLLFTSDYVLDELITLIFRRESFAEGASFIEGVLGASERGILSIERINSQRFTEAWRLRRQLSDKPSISFTDISSMVIMKEKKIKNILTEDDHFLQVGMGFKLIP